MPVPPEARVMLVRFKEVVAPEGDDDVPRLTVPANPLRLVSVTVDIVVEPEVMVRLDGVEMAKSVTFTATCAV